MTLPSSMARQGGRPFGFSFQFQNRPPRQDDIISLAIEFQYLEIKGLAYHLIQVPDGPQIRLGPGQKCLNPDIHGKSALDPIGDLALDGGVGFENILDSIPHLDLGGLFLGQENAFLFLVPALHHDLDLIIEADIDLAVFIMNS
jgi:hypothetical protein